MITMDEAIRALELFRTKADRLERSKFRTWLDEHRGGYSFQRVGEGWRVEWEWPEDEDVVDAFLLTLRMFYQEKDTISVSRLPALYKALYFSGEPLEKLTFARKQWLGYLRRNSTLVSRDKGYTNREVLELILFGDRAHIDLDHRTRYDSWYSNAGSRAILETRFADIVEFLSTGILVLRDLHAEALAALPPPADGQNVA